MSKKKVCISSLPKKDLSLDDILSENSSRRFEFCNVFLEYISVEGQSVREAVDDDHVIELSMSMAKNGLLEPIVLQFVSENKYQLIAGFHRLTAAHRLKWEKIPAHVIFDIKANVKALALVENVVRKSMTLIEECDAVSFLTNDQKLSVSQICDLIGKGRGWVEKRIMAPGLQEDVKDALFDNLIKIGVAEELGRVIDDSQRKWLLSYAISNQLSQAAVRVLVDQSIKDTSIPQAIADGEAQAEIQVAKKTHQKPCQACGQLTDFTNLVPVWVHKDGCPEPEHVKEETTSANGPKK